jgi:drug/metabolite transporter (DMT)-like permease
VRSADAALAHQNSLTKQRHGIAFAVATALLFSFSDALIKQLVVMAPFVFVLWLRYVFQLSLMSAWVLARGSSPVQAGHWRLHLLRCCLLAVSSVSGYLALRHVPLAEYTALMMLAPVVSVVLGRVVLKEHVSAQQWMCVLLGALGMLAVLRPGFSAWTPQALLPVASAFAYAAFQMTSCKLMAVSDIVISNLISAAFIVGVTSLGLLVWPLDWPEVWRQLGAFWWAKFGLMCLLATGGQLSLTAALQKSSLSVAAPFAYLQILFAALIGLVFFDHWPDRTTLFGTALIAVAGIGSALLNGRTPAPRRT